VKSADGYTGPGTNNSKAMVTTFMNKQSPLPFASFQNMSIILKKSFHNKNLNFADLTHNDNVASVLINFYL